MRLPPLLIEPIVPPLPRETERVPAVMVSVPPTCRFETELIVKFAEAVAVPFTVNAPFPPVVTAPPKFAVPPELIRMLLPTESVEW